MQEPKGKGFGMIDKIGAIIIKDRKMLVARSRKYELFFVPGGKRETGESDDQTLRREIKEELGTKIKDIKYYKTFITEASGRNGKVKVASYFCKLVGEPKPTSEIEEIMWIGRNDKHVKLGNVLLAMMPELVKDGYL